MHREEQDWVRTAEDKNFVLSLWRWELCLQHAGFKTQIMLPNMNELLTSELLDNRHPIYQKIWVRVQQRIYHLTPFNQAGTYSERSEAWKMCKMLSSLVQSLSYSIWKNCGGPRLIMDSFRVDMSSEWNGLSLVMDWGKCWGEDYHTLNMFVPEFINSSTRFVEQAQTTTLYIIYSDLDSSSTRYKSHEMTDYIYKAEAKDC